MKHVLAAFALCVLTVSPALGADWYILCVKERVVEGAPCMKCSAIFRVFSETKPAGGCTAIGMRPVVLGTRQEALEWKSAHCTCP